MRVPRGQSLATRMNAGFSDPLQFSIASRFLASPGWHNDPWLVSETHQL